MIQRIQSVFLLVLAIAMFVALLVPFWKGDAIEKTSGITGTVQLDAIGMSFTANGLAAKDHKGDLYYIAALTFLIGLTSLYALFQYKNRKTQMKLVSVNYLLLSGLIGTYFLAIDQCKTLFEVRSSLYDIGFYLPVFGIILNFFALRYIKKDEDLIRSVDRLR